MVQVSFLQLRVLHRRRLTLSYVPLFPPRSKPSYPRRSEKYRHLAFSFLPSRSSLQHPRITSLRAADRQHRAPYPYVPRVLPAFYPTLCISQGSSFHPVNNHRTSIPPPALMAPSKPAPNTIGNGTGHAGGSSYPFWIGGASSSCPTRVNEADGSTRTRMVFRRCC